MNKQLRLLIIDDSEKDATLLLHELTVAGYQPTFKRVTTESSFSNALNKDSFDIIISDYSLASFNALDALVLLKEKKLTTPFLIVSSSAGEDIVVKALLTGAKDFILKGKWERLVPAINRELQKVTTLRLKNKNKQRTFEEQQKTQRYLDLAGVMLVSLDINGNIALINKKGCSLLGLPKEEIIGKNWFDNFIPEHLRSTIKPIFKQLVMGEIEPVEYFENPILNAENEERLIAWHNSTLRDEEGNITHIFSSGEDITVQTKALESLRVSEEKYRDFVEASNDWIWECDENTIFTYCAPNVQKLLGYHPDELLGKSPFDLMLPNEAARIKKDFIAILAKKKPFALLQNKNLHKDGHLVTLETNGVPIFDKLGNFKGYQGIDRDITERIKMEKALEESERKFRLVITNNQAIVFILDKNGIFTLSEGKGLSLLNLKPAEVVGQSIFELYKDNPDMINGVRKTLAGEEYKGIQQINNFVFDVSYSPDFDKEGNIIGLTGFAIDITERINAEETRKESDERLQSLTSSINDAIISADSVGRIFSWNQGAEKIFGYTEKEAIGLPLTLLMPKGHRDANFKSLQKILSTKTTTTFVGQIVELRGLRKNGTEFPLELSLGRWEKHQELFFSAIIRDISERKKSEKNLQKLRNAIEQTVEMVVITDVNGEIEYINPAFTKITEFNEDETLGKKLNILKSNKQSDSFYQEMWATINSGKIWKGNLINKKKSGELYDEEMTISPIQDDNGIITHFVAIKADISEEKELQQQLIHTEKLSTIGTFVAGVAHELNNPLTTVMGYSEMLLKDEILPESAKKMLNTIFTQSHRTVEIVKNLLKFSRKEADRMTSLFIPEIINSVIQLNHYRLKVDNIQILTDFTAPHANIQGNMGQLQQVFMNIIVNAHHAIMSSKQKGTIKCKTKINSSNIVITIENDGPFIERQDISHIFDPFFTRKKVGEGTGLGLYISHKIIENHNGTIKVENIESGGVCFTITLPLDKTKMREEPKGVHQEKTIKGLKALLIDDEETIRELFATILLKEGCFCITAANGEEGIQCIQESNFDIIITDIKMPVMNGYDVALWLKKYKPDALTKLIFLSGIVDHSIEDFCNEHKCSSLIKPVTKEELLRKIYQTLNQ